MVSGTGGKVLAGLMVVIGGVLLILNWGLYLSLWSIIGLLLGCFGLYGGALVFQEKYARGGTLAAAAGIVAWGLYPTHPLSTVLLATVMLLGIGGIVALILELVAD